MCRVIKTYKGLQLGAYYWLSGGREYIHCHLCATPLSIPPPYLCQLFKPFAICPLCQKTVSGVFPLYFISMHVLWLDGEHTQYRT